jgi:dethiobiotin synthetase
VRGLFVTGTDTGVGKTVLSAALLAAMAAVGVPVRAHKPVVTGLDEQPPGPDGWPPDHVLLAHVAGMQPEEVAPLRYGPAVSPHLAAALAGERIEPARLVAAARAADPPGAAKPGGEAGDTRGDAQPEPRGGHGADPREVVVVEGVGGLLVPLAGDYLVRDLAAALGLPVVIAARPGLGTINHTLLTLHGARAAGLDVRAVVLTPWPTRPSVMEHSNRETIARLGGVAVEGLPHVPAADLAALGCAGETLPWREWLTRERAIPSQT